MGVDEHPQGFDAVVHLAAIPAPGLQPDAATFHNNMTVTYNVLRAAIRAGVRTIVTASSETVLGLPFDVPPPYIPVDEDCTRPESNYSLSKHLEEQLAIQLVRWHPDLSIQALRFSNVMDPGDYAEFPSYDSDPRLRKWNLWGYIDARDGAQAVLKAIQRGRREPGFERYIIAAADTVMTRPNAELVGEVFPGVELRGDLGVNTTLLSIEKARRFSASNRSTPGAADSRSHSVQSQYAASEIGRRSSCGADRMLRGQLRLYGLTARRDSTRPRQRE